MVRIPAEEVAEERMAIELAELNKALDLAMLVLAGICDCAQGAAGPAKHPEGCPAGGATTDQVAKALGLDPQDRQRSRYVKNALMPAMRRGMVRPVGKTKGLRWHWGRSEEDARL